MKKIIGNYLKENNLDLNNEKSTGIKIELINDELVVKGSKIDLVELADYIASVALSKNKKDHLHLDDLTLVNKDSKINSLIIEKE